MIFGVGNSQSGIHMTTMIQNFTLVGLISTIMSYPVRLPLKAAVFSYPMHLIPYIPNFSSFYLPARKIFRLGIYLRLSTCQSMHLSSSIIKVSNKELSYKLDTIDFFFCMVVNLVISICRNNWLDDERLSLEMLSS